MMSFAINKKDKLSEGFPECKVWRNQCKRGEMGF